MLTTPIASAALAFVLGLRHGLDADHLAAIDGLTRWNVLRKRPFGAWCGLLFAAGHGAIVLAAAVALAAVANEWQPPEWLESTGPLLSAAALLVLSFINLMSALRPAAGNAGSFPIGLRSTLFANLLRAPRAWQVALLGALFALSFDAIALAALFATSAAERSPLDAAGLALLFALGMAAIGTANGFWVARLSRHSDAANGRASRVMTFAVGSVGLLVASGVLLTLTVSTIGRWVDEHELTLSISVITLVLAGYFGALVLACRPSQTQSDPTSPSPIAESLSCAD